MRIETITVEELFRQYNHVIHLRRDERITILHGRNGVGKTAILFLVAALLEGRYADLHRYPFASLRVEFIETQVRVHLGASSDQPRPAGGPLHNSDGQETDRADEQRSDAQPSRTTGCQVVDVRDNGSEKSVTVKERGSFNDTFSLGMEKP